MSGKRVLININMDEKDYEKLKERFVEVRTKTGGLEMIGCLKEVDSDTITLRPAVPMDIFYADYGSKQFSKYLEKFLLLGKCSVMDKENISSITNSVVYDNEFYDRAVQGTNKHEVLFE